MVAEAQQAMRSLVIHRSDLTREQSPTHRLLNELGHRLAATASVDVASAALGQESFDLLVVDITDAPEKVAFVQAVLDWPIARQPRLLVVFADRFDDSLGELRRSATGASVHVFLKPLHLHGLLHLLKRVEAEQLREAIGA